MTDPWPSLEADMVGFKLPDGRRVSAPEYGASAHQWRLFALLQHAYMASFLAGRRDAYQAAGAAYLREYPDAEAPDPKERARVTCGNEDHPDGPWHPAAPLPASWEWIKRIRQWWRRQKWGCGCPRRVR